MSGIGQLVCGVIVIGGLLLLAMGGAPYARKGPELETLLGLPTKRSERSATSGKACPWQPHRDCACTTDEMRECAFYKRELAWKHDREEYDARVQREIADWDRSGMG